jgi:hypothetical protein
MKSYTNLIFFVLAILFGCKYDDVVEPAKSISYSGQYENVYYNDTANEPKVILYLAQESSKLSGVGYFNSIFFSFSGTLIDKHAIISFDLLNTNLGDLKNCHIDGYFGDGFILAGGYTLTAPNYGTTKIRFKKIADAE